MLNSIIFYFGLIYVTSSSHILYCYSTIILATYLLINHKMKLDDLKITLQCQLFVFLLILQKTQNIVINQNIFDDIYLVSPLSPTTGAGSTRLSSIYTKRSKPIAPNGRQMSGEEPYTLIVWPTVHLINYRLISSTTQILIQYTYVVFVIFSIKAAENSVHLMKSHFDSGQKRLLISNYYNEFHIVSS